MKTIPLETVEAAWERMSELSEEETVKLAERMQEEQPFILVYLLAAERSEEEARDPGWLLELGAFVWSVMCAGKKKPQSVTDEQLEAAEEANTQHLEQLEQGSEMDWMEGARGLIKRYNQAPLLGVVIELLMAGQEETPELAGDEVGVGFLHLKTVIDALDQ